MKSDFSAYDQDLRQLWQDHRENPDNGALLHALCFALNIRAQHKICSELARIGLARHPNDANIYYELLIAKSLANGEELEEIGIALENLVQQRPGDLGSKRNLALYNFYMENDADAATLLNEIIEHFDPDHVDQNTYEVLAQLEHANNHFESCIEFCDKALAKPGPAARIVRLKGMCQLDMGQTEQAMASFEQALDLEPHFVWACHSLGESHFARSDYAKAFGYFGRAAAINPTDPNHYFLLAEAFLEAREFRMAISELEKLLWCKPAPPIQAEAHNALGFLWIQEREFAKAENHLKKAIGLAPEMAAANFNLSLLAHNQDDKHEEELQLKQTLDLDPEHLEAWQALGLLYLSQEELDEAEHCFESILDIDPEYANAYQGLSRLAQARHSPQNQLMYARTAAQLSPKNYEILSQLADALVTNNQEKDAIEVLRDALCEHSGMDQAIPQLQQLLELHMAKFPDKKEAINQHAIETWMTLLKNARMGSELARTAANCLKKLGVSPSKLINIDESKHDDANKP